MKLKYLILLVALFSNLFSEIEKPNIVILYADDMGVADVSYGNPKAKIQTPHLDNLMILN